MLLLLLAADVGQEEEDKGDDETRERYEFYVKARDRVALASGVVRQPALGAVIDTLSLEHHEVSLALQANPLVLLVAHVATGAAAIALHGIQVSLVAKRACIDAGGSPKEGRAPVLGALPAYQRTSAALRAGEGAVEADAGKISHARWAPAEALIIQQEVELTVLITLDAVVCRAFAGRAVAVTRQAARARLVRPYRTPLHTPVTHPEVEALSTLKAPVPVAFLSIVSASLAGAVAHAAHPLWMTVGRPTSVTRRLASRP